MDGNTAQLTATGVQVVVIGIGIFIIKNYIQSIKKGIEDIYDRQIKNCNRRFETFDKEKDEIWNALHEHGHSGLKGNDAKVTRQ